MRLAIFAALPWYRPSRLIEVKLIFPAHACNLLAPLTKQQREPEDRGEHAAHPFGGAPEGGNLVIGENAVSAFERVRAFHAGNGIALDNALVMSPGKQGAHGREDVPGRRMGALGRLADGVRNVGLCDRGGGLGAELLKKVLIEEASRLAPIARVAGLGAKVALDNLLESADCELRALLLLDL